MAVTTDPLIRKATKWLIAERDSETDAVYWGDSSQISVQMVMDDDDTLSVSHYEVRGLDSFDFNWDDAFYTNSIFALVALLDDTYMWVFPAVGVAREGNDYFFKTYPWDIDKNHMWMITVQSQLAVPNGLF